jgi:hypothetical protein
MKFLSSLALLALVSVAPAANAATMTGVAQSVTFDTQLIPQDRGAGAYDGVLHLDIAADGTVGGWYRSDDEGVAYPVVGGLTGHKLWLDLSPGSISLHEVEATYANGKIDGSTFQRDQTYAFTATPRK